MELHVHIHIHSGDDKANVEKIREVTRRLAGMAGGVPGPSHNPFGADDMSRDSEMTGVVGQLNIVTNELAARLQAALDLGITPATAERVIAEVTAVTAALNALGRDPNNPFPQVPPSQLKPGQPGQPGQPSR